MRLDCQLFGLNPAGPHYESVLLHAVNAVLLFLLLQRATGSRWRSLMVAALFALHPINVESVAWAAERKNVLSMLFFLLALHAYVGIRGIPALLRYAMVFRLFALGLLSKSQVITFPFLLLLWDYWPLCRIGAPAVARLPAQYAARPKSCRGGKAGIGKSAAPAALRRQRGDYDEGSKGRRRGPDLFAVQLATCGWRRPRSPMRATWAKRSGRRSWWRCIRTPPSSIRCGKWARPWFHCCWSLLRCCARASNAILPSDGFGFWAAWCR